MNLDTPAVLTTAIIRTVSCIFRTASMIRTGKDRDFAVSVKRGLEYDVQILLYRKIITQSPCIHISWDICRRGPSYNNPYPVLKGLHQNIKNPPSIPNMRRNYSRMLFCHNHKVRGKRFGLITYPAHLPQEDIE